MDNLHEKRALITGSSRGIGHAIATELARVGANIVIHYRARHDEALRVQADIHSLGRDCIAIQADISRADEIGRLVSEAGPIDVLVNNAGIAKPQPLEEITEADWDEVVDTNLKSCFLLTQAVLPSMRARRRGRIINLSSVAAQVGGIVGPHYAAQRPACTGSRISTPAVWRRRGSR